jgi:transcription elongation factor S-II
MSYYYSKLTSSKPYEVELAYSYFSSINITCLSPDIRKKLITFLASSTDIKAKHLLTTLTFSPMETLKPILVEPTKCSICINTTDKEVTLTCKHTFCQECIKQWIAACESKNHVIACPNCRHPIEDTVFTQYDLREKEEEKYPIDQTTISFRCKFRTLLSETLNGNQDLAGEIETAVWNANQKESLEQSYRDYVTLLPSKNDECTKEQIACKYQKDLDLFKEVCYKQHIENKIAETLQKMVKFSLTPYKNHMRNCILSCRQHKTFAQSITTGKITPNDIAAMSVFEMTSTECLEKQKKEKEQQALECMAQKQAIGTSMFTCGKCKEKNCTYYQMQTRSADEPMTTFVNCISCGNRWKF